MRIAVLGAGRIGNVHSSHLAKDRRVTELLIADSNPTRAAELAATCGGAAVAVDVKTAFDRRPDAVVIAASTTAHGPLLKRCVAEGIPTLCEKPLAKELEETVELVRLVESSNATVQIGLMRRFEPGNLRLREMLERGGLGTVLCIRAASHDRDGPSEEYAATSGGMFRDQLIHDFDAIRWVTQREVQAVYAAATVRNLHYLKRFDDVDTAAVILQMDDDVLATVVASREDGRGEDYRIEVIGTDDSVATGTNEHTPLLNLDATFETFTSTPYDGPTARFDAAYEAQTRHFLSVAAGEAPNRCTPREALMSVLVSLAAERSTVTDTMELVPDVEDVLAS